MNQENKRDIEAVKSMPMNKLMDASVTIAGAAAGAYVTGGITTGTAVGASVSNFVGENVSKIITTGYTPAVLGQNITKTVGSISGGAVARTVKDWVVGDNSKEKGNSR